ncbi:YdiU family protein [Aureimonas sp. AU12]|uniref:protein adenylyltransferase SelO n=1 Tax=Aureimonas sp. AU12 TaxID=1638161 RepID=UPI000785C25A|nr:YdiU family protein [Aureimonas sp. AU12]
MSHPIAFDNSYAALPPAFFARVAPTPVMRPRLIRLNRPLAEALGLDAEALDSPAGAAFLSGASVPEGADPIALAYAGHQFGQFVPQLGDGRAVLLGEVVDGEGRRFDIQLKGSGPTPFSRRGDGRAALGPVLREYLVSEAMAALGIPTTRALAAVETGESVLRETELPGAVLTRVAASHIRIGTFQFFAARGDEDGLRRLVDYAIARHDPAAAEAPEPALAFFEGVMRRQVRLVAQWMSVGFVHGVMNTDNMSISGETIDYGPCAFLDAYDPAAVFSSIDRNGRYAFANQPGIAHWNLVRLAESLLPLIASDREAAVERANAALSVFPALMGDAYVDGLRRKIGLGAPWEDGDAALAQDLLDRMEANGADQTLTFRRLCEAETGGNDAVRILFRDPAAFDDWAVRWRERLARDGMDPAERRAAMRRTNPAVIPRNHRVEAAIEAAVGHADFGPFEALNARLSRPYDDQPGEGEPPPIAIEPYRTFCGT